MKRWKRYKLNRLAREAEARGETELAAQLREQAAGPIEEDQYATADVPQEEVVPPVTDGQIGAEVVTEPAPAPVVKKWKQYKQNRSAQDAAATKASEANKAADLILSLLEAFGTTFAGPDAAISPMERVLFDASLPQMIRDMESETFRRVQQIALPGILLVGFGSYTLRVWNLYAAQHPPDEPGKKPPQEPLPPVAPVTMEQPQNGREAELTTPRDFRTEMAEGNRDI